VRLRYSHTFARLLNLDELREEFTAEQLDVVRRGNQLSILPVEKETARRILDLLGKPAEEG